MAILPSSRPDKIAAEIHRALSGIVAVDTQRGDATKEQRAASERAVGAREAALLSLAKTADRDRWSSDEIEGGIASALSQRNSKDNSVATFAAEIKRACHPGARRHAHTLAELCTEAWDEESKAGKDYPRPCRKAFARRYHMLVATFREAVDGRVFTTRQEIVRWAVSCDPDRDPAKVLKRIQALRSQLRALAGDWPHGEFLVCAAALGRVTLDGLIACRSPQVAEAAPTEAPEPEPAGGGNILDEALEGLVAA